MIRISGTEFKFARALQKYLFYLELATLAGELKGGVKQKIRQKIKTHAKEALSKKDDILKLQKKAKNAEEINQLDEVVEHLNEVSGLLQEYLNLLKSNPAFIKAIKYVEKNRALSKFISIELEAMVRIYTGGTYRLLNKSLRGLEKMTDSFKAMQKILDNALNKLPISNYNKTTILKRATFFKEHEIKNLFKEGKTFTEKGFFSVTHSDEALLEWMKVNPTSVIFRVQGKNAKLIEDASMLPFENELLFKSGTSFEVVKINKIDHPLNIDKIITEIVLKEL